MGHGILSAPVREFKPLGIVFGCLFPELEKGLGGSDYPTSVLVERVWHQPPARRAKDLNPFAGFRYVEQTRCDRDQSLLARTPQMP